MKHEVSLSSSSILFLSLRPLVPASCLLSPVLPPLLLHMRGQRKLRSKVKESHTSRGWTTVFFLKGNDGAQRRGWTMGGGRGTTTTREPKLVSYWRVLTVHKHTPPIGNICVLLIVPYCLHLEPSDVTDSLSSVVGDILDPTDLECSLCMRSDLLYCLIHASRFNNSHSPCN